jgi:hypothetical protein
MTDIDKSIEEAKAEILPFESWERLAGESGGAWAAFCSYRDYGPGRNIRRAVEAVPAANDGKTEQGKPEKRYRMWRAWAARFRWRERAADYDQYLDRLKQTEKRKTIEAREAVYRETTGKMLRVVNKKLDVMNPDDLTQTAVKEWVETAIRAEREIAGPAVSPDDKRENQGGKQLEIRFTPEFEGL